MVMTMKDWLYVDGKKPFWKCPIEHDGYLWGMDANVNARRFFRIENGTIQREYNIQLPKWLTDEVLKNVEHVVTSNISDQEKADKALLAIQEKKKLSPELFNPPKVEFDSKLDKQLEGIIPNKISPAILDKWQKMKVEERLIMLQSTHSKDVMTRKGKGGTYKYVDIGYMVKCANMAFGFAWSSHVEKFEKTDTEILCFGYIRTKINNDEVIKFSVGQQDIAYKKDENGKPTTEVVCIGDNYKAAESDMIKKALSQFGIASDVYNNEV